MAGSKTPSGDWGLALVLICCAVLPTEVLVTCGVALALLQLLGQISQTDKKTPSKPKLPPGLSLEQNHHSPGQTCQRPVRPRVSPNRAHAAPRGPQRSPPQPRPFRVLTFPAEQDSEASMLAALEAYEAVSGASPEDKDGLPPAPPPSTSLDCLSSNLLGHASVPDAISKRVEEVLLASLPQVRIYNFSRTRGTDGYSLPALEVVIYMRSDVVSTACLQERLQRGMRGAKASGEAVSGEKLQKSVLRHCLSLLVDNGFKFRRSAFKAESPTVSLLAPAEYTDGEVSVGIELSVNNPLPFLNAALVSEASLVDERAFTFVTSVQRWADARGLAHVAFGPLNTYAWAHLAIFYLQTQVPHHMPPIFGGSDPPGLVPDLIPEKPPALDVALFKGFFEWIGGECLWKSGSLALRGSPPHGYNIRAGAYITLPPDGGELVICDAFRPHVDLGLHLRKENAIARIKTDAALALDHFSASGTVADLLAKPDFRAPQAAENVTGETLEATPASNPLPKRGLKPPGY